MALPTGITVLLATRLAFPVSTTHGLLGALAGAGLVEFGTNVNFSCLGKTLVLPLLLSPVIAVAIAAVLYVIFSKSIKAADITVESCICVGNKQWIAVAELNTVKFTALQTTNLVVDTKENCVNHYQVNFLGINFHSLLNVLHYISAGIGSFTRGLNDNP